MSRHRLLAAASALVLLAGTGTLLARTVGEDEGHAPAIGIPSSEFWAHRLYPSRTLSEEAREHEGEEGEGGESEAEEEESGRDEGIAQKPISNVLYQGNTDTRFLKLTKQAAALGRTGRAWKNKGPFHGVESILGTGSGAEMLGKVGGIGTAMVVDPSDRSGNTVYLGTIGGLYKTTNGGKTVHNITEGKIAREAVGAIAVDPQRDELTLCDTSTGLCSVIHREIRDGNPGRIKLGGALYES